MPDTIQRLDFIVFDLVPTLSLPFYLAYIVLLFGSDAAIFLSAIYLLLLCISVFNMALVFDLFNRSVGTFGWKLALIFPFYQGVYLTCARFFSYSSEIILASSRHDDFVPPRVLPRTVRGSDSGGGQMNVILARLDPHIPDPIESRRRAAGRIVRTAYATIVFGVLAFFVVYFGRPILYLGGPGTVSSPRYVVSLPYIVQVNRITVLRGATVKAGEEIGQVRSPQQDDIVATYMRALADVAGRRAELRVKARVARESLEAARSHLRLAEEAVERIAASSAASPNYRIDMSRERALANKAVVSQEAEAAEATTQLAALDEFSRQLGDRLEKVESSFADGGSLRR